MVAKLPAPPPMIRSSKPCCGSIPPSPTNLKACSTSRLPTGSVCWLRTRLMPTLQPPCAASMTSPPNLGHCGSSNGRRATARLAQQDVVAMGAGSLRLTPRGGLDGELRLTVVGIEKLLKMLDIDRIMTEGQVGATFNALDRLMPGLGGIARQSAAPGLVAALGERTTLEGKPAVAFPVRFVDGTVFIGPFQVGVVPPLF